MVAAPGTEIDPAVHHAVAMDEGGAGEKEVVAEELQAGYRLDGRVLREAMVRVGRG
jgi:molecular chaperone GrpE